MPKLQPAIYSAQRTGAVLLAPLPVSALGAEKPHTGRATSPTIEEKEGDTRGTRNTEGNPDKRP